MTLTFYNCTSPSNQVNKTLGTATHSASVDPNGPINRVDPVFIIDNIDAAGTSKIGASNYVVAGYPLDRSYFIVSVDFTVAKIAIITCHVDVLSTYSSLLTSTTLNYVRGAGDLTEMDDSSYPISDYLVEQYYPMDNWTDIFSNRGDGRRYLLRTIRGEGKVYPIVTMTAGQLFYCGQYDIDGNGNVHYKCYELIVSGDSAAGNPVVQSSITGVTFLSDQYYVKVDTKVWQMTIAEGHDTYPKFVYQGSGS